MDQCEIDATLIQILDLTLATLRHEVGNSINSLKITLDVLQENYDFFDDQKRKEYLKRLSELLARQQKLVDAMKSYARFEVKEPDTFDFLPFWEHLLSMSSSRLMDTKITLNQRLETGPCAIIANQVALSQVIKNLLDNALEAVLDSEEPQIELSAAKEQGYILLAVKDNGPGIRKSDIPKVFIPLYTTKAGKMGMGLAIVRKLLSGMEGRIEILSRMGQGTEARLWLKTGEGKSGSI